MYSLFDLAKYLNVPEGYYNLFSVLILILVIIVALLKGLALWRSARSSQKVWFWVFVFVNTVGILEIIYLLTNKEEGAREVITEKKEIKTEEKKEEEPIVTPPSSQTPSGTPEI